MPATFGERVLYIWERYSGSFLRGAGNTMLIALISTLIGCIIGFIVGIIQTIPTDRKKNPIKWFFVGLIKFILNVYVEVFRGTYRYIVASW